MQGWDYYTCEVEGGPASVLVDLDTRASAPRKDQPLLIYVHVHLRRRKADGLSDPRETSALRRLEDALVDAMEGLGASYVGRLTARGGREFYFYVQDELGLRAAIRDAVEPTGYLWRIGGHRDPRWEHYLRFLWPNEREMQGILSRRLVKALVRRGDKVETPRPVTHELRFDSPTAAQAFTLLLPQAWDWRVDGASLEVVGVHAVDSDSVIERTRTLWDQAETLGGRYLGWSTVLRKAA